MNRFRCRCPLPHRGNCWCYSYRKGNRVPRLKGSSEGSSGCRYWKDSPRNLKCCCDFEISQSGDEGSQKEKFELFDSTDFAYLYSFFYCLLSRLIYITFLFIFFFANSRKDDY